MDCQGYMGETIDDDIEELQFDVDKHVDNVDDLNDDYLDDVDVEAILARHGQRRPINFYEAPEFVKRLNAFEEVEVGSSVVFGCQWKALPDPALKWYKDDEEVTEDPHYRMESDAEGNATLVIENCRRQDEGAYKCKAENQEGVASTTGYLSVTGDNPEKTLSSKARNDGTTVLERCVSLPPHLCAIREQYSLEEREAEELSTLPPSPLQDFIDQVSSRQGRRTWPMTQMGYGPDWCPEPQRDDDARSSSSDTSVESQLDDLDLVSFEVTPEHLQNGDMIPGELTVITPSDTVQSSPNGIYKTGPQIRVVDVSNDVDGHEGNDSIGDGIAQDSEVKQPNKHLKRTVAVELSETGTQQQALLQNNHIDRNLDEDSVKSSSKFNVLFEEEFTNTLDTIMDSYYYEIPWVYYFAFVVSCTFVALETKMPPPVFIVLVSLLSLFSFRMFIKDPIKIERETKPTSQQDSSH